MRPIVQLFRQPHQFEFHQAVRLIENWVACHAQNRKLALQFRNAISLSFPASEIAALDVVLDDVVDSPDAAGSEALDPSAWQRIEITPSFMSLLGASGVLPLAYSEQLIAREILHRDSTARAFLDIFQHRAVTLFHAAWHKHRLPLRSEARGHDHGLSMVLSLAGMGSTSLQNRLLASQGGVSDHALAYYAGLLQRRCISASHLQRVLSDYFGVAVNIKQLIGRWCALASENLTLLGSANAVLGRNALLGGRVWQRDLRLRVVVGPLSEAQYRRFLPGRPGALALKELLTLSSGVNLEYEVHLRLRVEAVALTRLGGAATASASHLGWNTFLLSQPSQVEREERVYELHAVAV
ncbi:type VI secretion system baseplate subunit TssG [Azohydromonas sp. G-1-1-14]|uniref:Type VI secretion system baseplate subunit TssG n=2 Tax=Azohydromonas caseinilytica TaxID=2728836 RepID=A0A848FLE0_9BURK|nr:type VI secretion system baseplate subunit TssG [Azohydromonas caseinilytica]